MPTHSIICDIGSTREKTREGFLKVRIRATRTGVMRYNVNDISGVEDIHGTGFVYIARKPEDVFNEKSLATLRDCSITVNHPKERHVNAKNYKAETVGHVTDYPEHDERAVYVPAIIKDENAVNAIESEKDEVSVGADAQVFRETGIMDGQSYDYTFKNIIYNHISIVESGRAGDARILDEGDTMTEEEKQEMQNLKTLNDQLTRQNQSLTERIDKMERESVINDAKIINPDFQPEEKQTAKQIKVAVINDAAITDSSSDELIDYAFNNMKKRPSYNPPVVELSSETTKAGEINDSDDDAPIYNQWDK